MCPIAVCFGGDSNHVYDGPVATAEEEEVPCYPRYLSCIIPWWFTALY